MNPDHHILGVILAGGASRRFGADKALVPVAGLPLIEHVVRRARPQVEALAVGRDAEAPLPIDLPRIPDKQPAQGPLSGIVSSLAWAEVHGFTLLASFPCDGPLFPSDLVARLESKLTGSDCAMACSRAEKHYTYGLWRTDCLPRLAQAFDHGLRSLRGAADVLAVNYEDFGPDAFFNVNRPEDIDRAEQLLARQEASE